MLQIHLARESGSTGPDHYSSRGRVVFAELKTEIGRLSNIQRWQISELQARGAEVRVLKGVDQVLDFLREVAADEIHAT